MEEKEIISLEEIDRQYRETAATLLERIAKRDELKTLLKIAKPAKIAPLRELLAQLDKIIEMIENELENLVKMREKRLEVDARNDELMATVDKIKPEFLAHIAEHHPEKLKEMKELFDDEDSIKTL